jgi:hypothetical protein
MDIVLRIFYSVLIGIGLFISLVALGLIAGLVSDLIFGLLAWITRKLRSRHENH